MRVVWINPPNASPYRGKEDVEIWLNRLAKSALLAAVLRVLAEGALCFGQTFSAKEFKEGQTFAAAFSKQAEWFY